MISSISQVPLKMIVAMDAGGGIGNNGKLPWPKNSADFAHFKEVTKNSVVIMGRTTFEEIEEINNAREHPCPTLLEGRKCVVVSSKEISSKSEIFVEKSLEFAVKYHFSSEQNIFVIGGLQLYMEALPWVNTIYATVFDEHYTCDKYLPLRYLTRHFNIVDGKMQDGFQFITLNRVI